MAGNPPQVSELRFAACCSGEQDDLYGAMIRILQMLEYSANLPDLMSSVFIGETRYVKRWAFGIFPTPLNRKTA